MLGFYVSIKGVRPLFAPVMAMILSFSWIVLTGPESGTAFILAAEEDIL